VDAGCGEGRDSFLLLQAGLRVIALDAAPSNLQTLSQKVSKAQLSLERLTCHVVDLVEGIPLEDEAADAVLDVWVLGSVILTHDGAAGAQRYLAAAHRVLKPGGIFVCEFETFKPRCSGDKLRECFANLVKGYFSIVQSEAIEADYPPYLEFPFYQKVPLLHKIVLKIVRKRHPAIFVVAGKEQTREGVNSVFPVRAE
jgi:SAM-dependent methyltransferase